MNILQTFDEYILHHSGYRRGNIPLPQIPVRITLQPSADPRINDRTRIQNAIDWVGRQPPQKFTLRDGKTVIQTRGAVLLQAGIYRIQGALILNKSGVVLRGEGNGPSGTVLMAMGQFKHDFIHLNGLLDTSFQGTPEYLARYGGSKLMNPKDPYVIQDEHVTYLADENVPVGTKRVPVKDISNFKVGAEVVVEYRPKSSWIHLLGMDRIPPRPDSPGRTLNWRPHQYTLRYVRKVMAVEKSVPRPRNKRNKVKTRGQATSQKSRRYILDANANQIDRVDPIGIQGLGFIEDTESEYPLVSDRMPINVAAKDEEDMEDDDYDDDDEDDDDDVDDDDDEDEDGEDTSSDNPLWVPGYVTLDIPMVMNMDPKYGHGVVYNFARETPIPSDVGVENLALWSEYDPSNLEDEQHGWFAVMIDNCENCWATDIKATNFVSGIKAASGSKHVTIQDCEILEPISLRREGGRRYMYMVQGQMVLVKRCFATDARHDFMTGAKTPGPNVFVDSEGIRANNDAGPHDRWTTGSLYDNIHSYDFNVRNRGWMGSGQGWAGAFHVVYRCSADIDSKFQSPPRATNWVIDYRGTLGEKSVEFRGDEATFLEPEPKDYGSIPRSLYWSQLVARMGGGNDIAKVVEDYVGVAGKNSYQAPQPRRFMTADEIMASQEAIGVDNAFGQVNREQEKEERNDIVRLEVDITSETDIEEVLNRFEENFLDSIE
ncbi:hypothetical protein BGX27_005927 [Mortierella sp. AM989]|nr:hypothetical protein BGX27_005927 [Mortierella sp. AM989]